VAEKHKNKGKIEVMEKMVCLSTLSNKYPPRYAVIRVPILLIPKNKETFLAASYYYSSSVNYFTLAFFYDISTNKASPITLEKAIPTWFIKMHVIPL